ncbi:hypothetical protein FQA39_LY03560 [Lamprigera yunnana]|nr:hypothetical protein FQA39_LY03560 [Lamprigera yunnana]
MRANKKTNLCLSKGSPQNVDADPDSQRQGSGQWKRNIEHTSWRDNPEQINSLFKPAGNVASRHQQDETPHDRFTEPIQTQSSGRSCRQKRSRDEYIDIMWYHQCVLESKGEEWIKFYEQRENINKYFQTFDTMWKPRQIGSKTLTFEMIKEKKILRIEDICGNEVYLGWESVPEVWSVESVLNYRLSYSSGSNFKHFYEDVIRAVAEMSGDVKINIYNNVNRLSEKYDYVCKIQFNKKMWMLCAEQHWTKAIDLKSAVERLYEKLGALEFDADHEAIYGMEKYCTVQKCENFRDKYKIGRKLCRKFLKGKTCSQYL